ncbi:MAG: quercetin 2,3-dioxygenase [Blastocatellia bacterium]|jgi:redox-sensitive bicupin YhaK (pirin superfamily)|nr:quercetin 2,3-dioxygenase [Blastocatellia bacterium]
MRALGGRRVSVIQSGDKPPHSKMITIRKSEDRGHFDFGWLNTYHTFSFDQYYDPAHMHFRSLRVINEDRVQPAHGFPTHSHRDMEIITYILSGALEHRDSMGNGSVIRPGDVQRMSAGTGVSHSESNPSETEPVHLLQIWILPQKNNLSPSYEEKHFSEEERHGRLRVIASNDGREGSVTIHQDVRLLAAVLEAGQTVAHALDPQRSAWLQVARGTVGLNELELKQGDGAAVSDESELAIKAHDQAEVLLFDLA